MLEFGIGHKYLSTLIAYRRLNKKLEMVGWWGNAASFVIITYYGVVMGWALLCGARAYSTWKHTTGFS